MQPSEIHYAVKKLMDTANALTTYNEQLLTLRTKMEKQLLAGDKKRARDTYEDLKAVFNRVINVLSESILFLIEMQEDELVSYAKALIKSLKQFNLLTPDYSALSSEFNKFIGNLPIYNEKANAAVIGRLMNNVKMGYYATDLEHVKYLVKGIEFPEGIITNLLDPCCGQGYALRTLAEGNNCYTYGIELDESRAEDASTILHRVGFGSFFYSRVSNDAFHILFLNPPYINVISENGRNIRNEKKFLVESINHLMMGGLLIYIIPYYRLSEDICRVICDNFQDITLWKFSDNEFKKFKQVAVLGIKKKREKSADIAKQLSEYAYSSESIPELQNISEHRYRLPAATKKISLFKGDKFNVIELAEQLKHSPSVKKQYKQFGKHQIGFAKPPLPLSIGQVGLIGGSGLINGLINCETPHVLKGRIVKELKKEYTTDSKTANEISTEIITNKMIFNILTPDGVQSLT